MQTHYVKNMTLSGIEGELPFEALHNKRLYINPAAYTLRRSSHRKWLSGFLGVTTVPPIPRRQESHRRIARCRHPGLYLC